MITCPEPGIYTGVPMEIYHAWDAVGNSHLGQMKRSPRHYRYWLDHEQDQTEPMKLGTAAHMAILEWERFQATYRVHLEGARNTKAVKDDMAAIEGAGFIPLRPSEMDMIDVWRENIAKHPAASAMLESATHLEISIVWDQMVEGCRVVRCKARPDLLCEVNGKRICNDLKTAREAGPAFFGRSVASYGYNRGAAHYLAGLQAVDLACRQYVFTVLEKNGPFEVATYHLDENAYMVGREEWWRLLSQLAECRERNEWPGYSPEIEELSVPAYALAEGSEDPITSADLSNV